ncbi:MAG: bacterioferritin-associated ferredoxin [Alphaproteobacteria bacterium]
MYICLCNGLKDKQIESAVAGGACSVADTFRKLGCQPMCGQCVPMIQDTVESRMQVSR